MSCSVANCSTPFMYYNVHQKFCSAHKPNNEKSIYKNQICQTEGCFEKSIGPQKGVQRLCIKHHLPKSIVKDLVPKNLPSNTIEPLLSVNDKSLSTLLVSNKRKCVRISLSKNKRSKSDVTSDELIPNQEVEDEKSSDSPTNLVTPSSSMHFTPAQPIHYPLYLPPSMPYPNSPGYFYRYTAPYYGYFHYTPYSKYPYFLPYTLDLKYLPTR